MKKIKSNSIKKEHAPGCTCSICGLNYKGYAFKSGYICETCLEYIKNSYSHNEAGAKQST